MEERKHKWKRDKLNNLAGEIKAKYKPQIDPKKQEEFRAMTDADEVDKKLKRKKKIVRDKNTNAILEEYYVVPKTVEDEKYQSELYR